MMSPGRLLWLARRDLGRGWDASYHDYQTLPKIDGWEWPYWGEQAGAVPVHVLTGAKDWRLAAWMLASLFTFTDVNWPVTIHDDGTLPEEAHAVMEIMFRHARFISRTEADAAMRPVLKPFPKCSDYRASHPLGLKIFDMAHFAPGSRFLVIDSDVLFFQKPFELIEWQASPDSGECWFNEDVQEAALISREEAREKFGIDLWSRVNSGLCLLHRPAVDFDLCERALSTTNILGGQIWRVEQTLFALCASKLERGGLLPRTYEVSLAKNASPGIIARHYVGAVRNRFYGEGIKRLHQKILSAVGTDRD